MRILFQRYWPVLLFAIIGVAGGFLYWRFIGCNSGTCPITASWHTSSIAGGLIGYLGGSSIIDFRGRKGK